MNRNLLLIFTRNPELGKCKTRLAACVGDAAALDIYTFLLHHTVSITKALEVEKWVCYSESIGENDMWAPEHYKKKVQRGANLGRRMQHAFQEGFDAGYQKIVIIGSDMYHLSQNDIEEAFAALDNCDYVIGPAEDGGYYLLGMKALNKALFQNKAWSTPTVLQNTLDDVQAAYCCILPVKNDIDIYEDVKDIAAFQPFLKPIKNDPNTT